ncbi:RNA-dependent RNA polymerase SHL2 [Apiospora kogelbergensis]|uniref:RNA-dependent RNA polymerase n=1 Tax=Apiospora kogelbergensis TaxID=1337665 RepID=A0AAW0R2P9_9PEZI
MAELRKSISAGHSSQGSDAQPEFSPYASSTVTVALNDGTTFYVPKLILDQFPQLSSLCAAATQREAHVVVHYLLADTYQCLKSRGSSHDERLAAEFTIGVSVYTLARVYQLPSLADVAKSEAEKVGTELSVSTIFNLVYTTSTESVKGDPWPSDYLKSRLRAFLEQPTVARNGPVGQSKRNAEFIDDSLLAKLLDLIGFVACNRLNDGRPLPQDPCHRTKMSGADPKVPHETYSPTTSEIDALEVSFNKTLGLEPTGVTRLSSTDSSKCATSSPETHTPASSTLPSVSQDAKTPESPIETGTNPLSTLETCLDSIWVKPPLGLEQAPLPVLWEVTRAALHCAVDPGAFELPYDDEWMNQDKLWSSLQSLEAFRGALLPQKSDPRAWSTSLGNCFQSGNDVVVLKASVLPIKTCSRPGFRLQLQPLQLTKGCRLHRRFGSDRFLEVIFPALESWGFPKSHNTRETTARWLTQKGHSFAGREWTAFWIGSQESSQASNRLSNGSKIPIQQRVHFFAEDGFGFLPNPSRDLLPSREAASQKRTVCRRKAMLNWHLRFAQNKTQCYLKLFSRIQLGLSKTDPVVELQESQIRNHDEDLKSYAGNVMNDGIGKISKGLMMKVRDALGLGNIPSAIQGRLGSAKGLWIVDGASTDDQDWIETYGSQRKWECDWSVSDQRVLELKTCAAEPRPATLNTQYLLILDDRATDKTQLRETIVRRLRAQLSDELYALNSALGNPQQFRQWVHENAPYAESRCDGGIPFLGGLPEDPQHVLNFLVDGGFDPLKQKFLQDLIFGLLKQKYSKLSTKLNIRIRQSTNVFMVVDFERVLKPGEVHLCFSSKFDDGVGEVTDLDGMDVLVSRCPAHLPSDIQKVTAVFKKELRHLRDVVVFPTTGSEPLANTLSGGDYDGDKAWVCWDAEIVKTFRNSAVPRKPGFDSYLTKDQTKVDDLLQQYGEEHYIDALVEKAIYFSLKKSYLGICTNFKETFCAKRNSINDEAAHSLGWLLSELADEAKQGLELTAENWSSYVKEIKEKRYSPVFETNNSLVSQANATYIIDDLKATSRLEVENGLQAIDKSMATARLDGQTLATVYDADLANYWDVFETWVKDSFGMPSDEFSWLTEVLDSLRRDLQACADEWRTVMGSQKKGSYQQNVQQVHMKWGAIQPISEAHGALTNRLIHLFGQSGIAPPELQQWELLKASMVVKLFAARMSPRLRRRTPINPAIRIALQAYSIFIGSNSGIGSLRHNSYQWNGDSTYSSYRSTTSPISGGANDPNRNSVRGAFPADNLYLFVLYYASRHEAAAQSKDWRLDYDYQVCLPMPHSGPAR